MQELAKIEIITRLHPTFTSNLVLSLFRSFRLRKPIAITLFVPDLCGLTIIAREQVTHLNFKRRSGFAAFLSYANCNFTVKYALDDARSGCS